MLNMIRNHSKWGARLAGVLGVFLLAGSGAAMAVTFNLSAKPGATTILPGNASVPVWGYVDTTANPAVTNPGGPTLIVNQGESVTVNLTNNLAAPTAILFQGQSMVPDSVGATAGGTKTYTFIASKPGTFLYEAGLLPNAQHQAAMGLYGALIVRPTSSGTPILKQAYSDGATAFNDEAVLVLSEIDPVLNANPATFDMRNYVPKYFLINGKPYPNTDPIASAAGNNVLLRYVNAGVLHHSMGVLGLRQNFVAKDAGLLPTLNHNVAAESLAPGQTGDAIATIPASATTASKFAVYDANLALHNNGSDTAFGGMLTFVTAGSAAPPGPVVTALSLVGSTLNATITAVSPINVAATEYWFDSGSHITTSAALPLAPTLTINSLSLTLPTSPGTHTLYLRGQDDSTPTGIWGAPRLVTFTVAGPDTTGPVTSGLTLSPNPSSGAVTVTLTALANDTATGNSNIAAARYTIDGGTPVSMTVSSATPTSSLSATIASGLAPGAHLVAVQSQDASLNWGTYSAPITLTVTSPPPVTSAVIASKNPNNGALALNASQPVVRVTATMTSNGSTISGAEAFIDAAPATSVRGFPFVPSDGLWNSDAEAGYADIPLANINALSAGNHTIYVRGKDAVGNWGTWGATSSTVLVIDKTPPSVASIARVGTTPTNVASVQFLVTLSKSVTGLGASNFTLTTTGGVVGASISSVTGGGTAYTVAVNTGTGSGNIGLNMTSSSSVADLAGNSIAPLPVVGQVYTIDKTPPTVSSITRVGTSPTNAASVDFLVTFSENVTGVTTGNFTLATTGVTGAAINSMTGSGNTYTVTVNTGTNTGSGAHTVGLNKNSNSGITDVVGNLMISGAFTGQIYNIDRTEPTLTSISLAQGNPTNATTRNFTVTFSESVTGVATSNFTLATTGVAGASITSVSGTGATRTVTVTTGTGSGTIGLNKTSNTNVADSAGNPLAGGTFTGQTYTVDKIAPLVNSINRIAVTPTNALSVQFQVIFSEVVTGVTAGRFTIVTTGGVTGASITSVTGTGATRTVTVTTGTGSGTIGLNKTSNGAIADLTGNQMTVGNFVGQIYTITKP